MAHEWGKTWHAAELFGTLCLRFGPIDTLCGAKLNPNTESVIIDNIFLDITCDKCGKIAADFKIPTSYIS